MENIAEIRKDYRHAALSEQDVLPDPIEQFRQWWEAVRKSNIDEPNAMTLATASSDGFPSARIVLLKGFDQRGFVFYTNYNSFKGQQLMENPRACLVFFWKELERQVRITGIIERVTERESEEYFNSRPEPSKISSAVSPQSEVIASREWLEEKVLEKMNASSQKQIQRPAHWGGYRVKPAIIEFWQGRESRLHDRIQYSLQENGSWLIERLAP
jgi:pyridoxamine 5'-phosphate oxidase